MEPMLACDADLSALDKLPYPLCVLTKYDGVRTLIKDGLFLGRSFKLHRNPYLQKLFGRPEYNGFDAEGIVGPDNHPRLVSITSGAFSRRRDDPKDPSKRVEVPDAKLYVFDHFAARGGFAQRHEAAARQVADILAGRPDAPIRLVPFEWAENAEQLLAIEDSVLGNGYEGLIVRRPEAPYKYGRATLKEGGYLRIKRFEEREGVIVGYETGFTNTNEAKLDALGKTERSTAKAGMVPNGEIAALLLRDVQSQETVKVAAGRMTQAEARLWAADFALIEGQVAKYKFFPRGIKDKIRFGTFQCIRSPEDM